jgi:hypothetical protein
MTIGAQGDLDAFGKMLSLREKMCEKYNLDMKDF